MEPYFEAVSVPVSLFVVDFYGILYLKDRKAKIAALVKEVLR